MMTKDILLITPPTDHGGRQMFAPLITLRCQTVVDGVMAFVKMPIELGLWDSVTDETRDRLRSDVRAELRHAVAARIGESRMDDRYDDLPVWEEYPNRCEVECIGGPLDGQRVTLNSAEPPLALQLPLPAELPCLPAPLDDSLALPIASYWPLRDEHGFLTRTADGAWRFSGR